MTALPPKQQNRNDERASGYRRFFNEELGIRNEELWETLRVLDLYCASIRGIGSVINTNGCGQRPPVIPNSSFFRCFPQLLALLFANFVLLSYRRFYGKMYVYVELICKILIRNYNQKLTHLERMENYGSKGYY